MPENLEKRGSKYYFRAVIGGKLYRRSTGLSDPQLARRRATEIENDIRAGRFGWTEKPDVPTFEAWAKHFLKTYHPGRETEATILRRAMHRWSTRKLDAITASEVTGYLRERLVTAKKGGVERERTLLKQLFRAAVDDKILTENPMGKIRRIRTDRRKRVMTLEEEKRIRAGAPAYWQRYLTVALLTGLRSGELRKARPDDLRENGTWLWVNPAHNKTRTERLVPLRPEVQQALKEQAESRVGDAHTPYFDVSRNTALMWLQRRCEKLAISPVITVHDLRRTFATRCAERGMWPTHLQKILGHTDIKITMQFYVHLEQKNLEDALAKITVEK